MFETRRPISRGRVRTAALIALTLFAAGCHDRGEPAAALGPRASAATTAGGAVDSAVVQWTRFSADVTVYTTVVGASPGIASLAPRSYHVDRIRNSDGTWTTAMLLPPPPTLYTTAAGVRVLAGPDIARIEIGDAGAAPRFFLRSGAPLTLPSVAEMKRGGIDVLGSLPANLQGRARTLLAGGSAPRAPSGGLARLLSTAQSREALRSALATSYRPAGRSDAGAERYARAAADTTLELTLDPVVGDVAEARVVVANREIVHMSYTFAQVAPNVYARSMLQLTRDLGAGRGTASTEVLYRNITLGQED